MQLFSSWSGPELGKPCMTNPIDVNDGGPYKDLAVQGLKVWHSEEEEEGGGGICAISSTELCDTNQENLPEVENLR